MEGKKKTSYLLICANQIHLWVTGTQVLPILTPLHYIKQWNQQGNPDLKIGSTSLKKWDHLASNTDRKTDVDLRIVLSDSLILNPVIARNTPTNAGLTSDFHILFVWYIGTI